MTTTFKRNVIKLIVFALIAVSFLVKLDYEYFFTDEILYLNAGREYILKSDYTLNLQHPFIAKYIVGAVSLIDERNVAIMRVPFALLGVACSYLVYLIIKEHFKRELYAVAGAIIYSTSYYLFQTSRMTMMESPMHFFWLLTSLLFFRYLGAPSRKNAVLMGVFLGFSIASKFTALTISPAMVIAFFVYVKTNAKAFNTYKTLLFVPLAAAVTFLVTYLGLFISRGFLGLTDVIRAIKDTIVDRNSEGKIHVIGDKVYSRSPWWFYLYYVKENYSISQKITSLLAPFSILAIKNYFTSYWMIFLLTNIALFSLMTLKNARYLASMELPAVFLIVVVLKFIYEKISTKAFYLIILIAMLSQASYLGKLERTSYSALYKIISERTSNFTDGQRLYILGSIRSSRWYFAKAPEDFVVSRKDFDVMAPEFPNFKYIAIENAEDAKDPQNALSNFVKLNADKYTLIAIPDIRLYVRN